MYGNRLTRDFGDSVPDPWRRAINTLTDAQIARGLRRLTAAGSSSTPTQPQFVKACRAPGDDEGEVRPAATVLPAPNYDHFHCFGQIQFFKFLKLHNVRNDQLPRLIARKNEIIDAARHDPAMQSGDEAVLGKELHEILFSAWRKGLTP